MRDLEPKKGAAASLSDVLSLLEAVYVTEDKLSINQFSSAATLLSQTIGLYDDLEAGGTELKILMNELQQHSQN